MRLGELEPPRVEEIDGLLVVRDDLVPGGSKTRFLLPLMRDVWPEREFVFGGPALGYAQIAMAVASRACGKRATYFVARRRELHPLTRKARSAGATIVEVDHGRLTVVQRRAKDYAAEDDDRRFLPLGFSLPEVHARIAEEAAALDVDPPEVWCVAGSGALTRGLQQAWPSARHVAVRIGMTPNVGQAELRLAPERFEDLATVLPPFPSSRWYDAKAWRFVREEAAPGALFWNVGM